MDKELERSLENLGRNIKKRDEEKVYQFSLWGDWQRGVPNDFARSALFTARKGTSGELVKNEKIFSQDGIEIHYQGVRLTQDHLDVYEAVMHLARSMPEGEVVECTKKGLLMLLNRSSGGADRKRLMGILTDLTATSVMIKREDKGRVYWGSLLPEGFEDENSEILHLRVSRTLVKFFQHGFTVIEQKQRKELSRSPLAKFLQCWLSSHTKPYPVTIEYLYNLSGSQTKELKDFKKALIKALDKLVQVEFLKSWDIDSKNKVSFVKI